MLLNSDPPAGHSHEIIHPELERCYARPAVAFRTLANCFTTHKHGLNRYSTWRSTWNIKLGLYTCYMKLRTSETPGAGTRAATWGFPANFRNLRSIPLNNPYTAPPRVVRSRVQKMCQFVFYEQRSMSGCFQHNTCGCLPPGRDASFSSCLLKKV